MPRFAITCLLAVLTGCAHQARTSDASQTAGAETPALAIERAVHALQEAGKVGFLWSDSENLLTEAKKASAQGENAQAVELAHDAQRQGELALNQYYLARARDLRSRLKPGESSAARSQELIRKSDGKAAFEVLAAAARKQGVAVAPFPAPSLVAAAAPNSPRAAPSYPVHHGRPAWTGIPPHP